MGNRYTTVAIIYRALTGKLGKGDSNPSVTQHKAIIKSLEILMSRIVDYGAEDTCQVMGYNNGNPFVAKVPLLPAAYIDFSTLNGDSDTLIFFTDEPPLLKMAQLKKNLHLMMLSLKDKLKYQLQLAFIPFIFLIETALIISYNKLALCFLNFVLLATIIL